MESIPTISGDMQAPQKDLTFGERAVGITLNPGGNSDVNQAKSHVAQYIDYLQILREKSTNPEVKRMLSVAITEAQTSQMLAVKAITWQY